MPQQEPTTSELFEAMLRENDDAKREELTRAYCDAVRAEARLRWGFWENRYRTQHRTLHSCEDALAEVRSRLRDVEAERDEAQRLIVEAMIALTDPDADAEGQRQTVEALDEWAQRFLALSSPSVCGSDEPGEGE